MASSSDGGVPRGDHVPGGNEATQSDSNAVPAAESAPKRAHGTHGKGVGAREELDDEPTPAPDFARGTDRGGSAAWGSERSGGSVIDKRSDDAR